MLCALFEPHFHAVGLNTNAFFRFSFVPPTHTLSHHMFILCSTGTIGISELAFPLRLPVPVDDVSSSALQPHFALPSLTLMSEF